MSEPQAERIEIEHEGHDELVYIPSGPDPMPLYLTNLAAEDLAELLSGERERVVLLALLEQAVRTCTAAQAQTAGSPLLDDAARVASIWRGSDETRAELDRLGYHGLVHALDRLTEVDAELGGRDL